MVGTRRFCYAYPQSVLSFLVPTCPLLGAYPESKGRPCRSVRQIRPLGAPSARLLSSDTGSNNDDAYIFQPSPFRQQRRHLHSRAGDASAFSTMTSSSSSSSSSSVSATNGRNSGRRSKTAEPPVRYESHAALTDALLSLKGDPLEPEGGRIVTFRGGPTSRLMVIGEAPGEQEDETGIPFVGNAGQLLDKIFLHGGFDLEHQLYITNIVKRRPPDNRMPTRAEIAFYLPFLQEEVRLVDPAIIILAGNVAARAFLGSRTSISSVRGTWFGGEDGKPWTMPVYHPSYLLRKQSMKREMVDDINAIRNKYVELFPDDPLKPQTSTRR